MSAALEQARAWLAQDPDPATRGELETLIAQVEEGDAAATADLEDRFAGRLAFGTAGLRGRLGAGSNRMNRVLVAQAAAGLAAYVLERTGDDRQATIVIGYDGRRNSDVFARDSAEIFAGAGIRALLLPRLLPTPVLAFAVRHLGADAGVMVTASHNPPDDNGYKVYLGGADDGAQIVPPADAEIAAHIQRVADEANAPAIPRMLAYETAPESVVEAYIRATAAVAPAPAGAEGLSWAYTAMHGVGWETLARILETAGYPAPTLVEAQIQPDGAFPTVAFPNPEEPGAMDLAFQTARETGAELIIANDPDADRLAVALPDDTADGGWRRLTGNEIGLLLGWRAAQLATAEVEAAPGEEPDQDAPAGEPDQDAPAEEPDQDAPAEEPDQDAPAGEPDHDAPAEAPEEDAPGEGPHQDGPAEAPAQEAPAEEPERDAAPRPSLACSLVSSPGLQTIAEHYGLDFHATLTGFKWISRAPGIVFGFEEALGYLVNPETVRDKDGISAAVAMLGLVADAHGRGSSLAGLLEEFEQIFGYFASDQISIRVEDLGIIARIMSGLREQHPSRIGEVPVTQVDDLAEGFEDLPPGDVLRLWLEDGSRVIVRPSGTEPKLKAYLDVRGDSAEDARHRLSALASGVRVLLDEHA
ncbi:phospho-sugar mutase [Microbacterium sp. NPDC019599]|uniref:phospho-sugar mutase n=1 Tax=Microbacterium sp. NPDC019599 TaxID=3154690 RepID=UPI0033F94FDF